MQSHLLDLWLTTIEYVGAEIELLLANGVIEVSPPEVLPQK